MIPLSAPVCPYCHNSMQVAAEKLDEKGNVATKQFICGCRTVPYFENYHAGDKTQEKS